MARSREDFLKFVQQNYPEDLEKRSGRGLGGKGLGSTAAKKTEAKRGRSMSSPPKSPPKSPKKSPPKNSTNYNTMTVVELKKILKEKEIDLKQIKGKGKNGAPLKQDIIDYLEKHFSKSSKDEEKSPKENKSKEEVKSVTKSAGKVHKEPVKEDKRVKTYNLLIWTRENKKECNPSVILSAKSLSQLSKEFKMYLEDNEKDDMIFLDNYTNIGEIQKDQKIMLKSVYNHVYKEGSILL